MRGFFAQLIGIWGRVLICATIGLSGCGTLPGQGPTTLDIALHDESSLETGNRAFAIIPLNVEVVQAVGQAPSTSISAAFRGRISGVESRTVGVGDQLLVNVWEASQDGLFSTAERKETTIEAVVDETGSIFIPYAGAISVKGMNVERVRAAIASRLVGQAVDPQVQVKLTSDGGYMLSVIGDVARPGRFDIPASGLRLIEAVALAGGTRKSGFETRLTIVRGDTRASVRHDDVVRHPENNIWLMPRDVVQVLHKPRSFTAFGAVTSQNLLRFETETVSLAEALAQSGGLNDRLADAGGVFLFRFENHRRLQRAKAEIPDQRYAKGIPTIYRLDFTEPQAFFLASSFMMRDNDIIYVANAPAVEFNKFISTIVSPFLGTARSVSAIGG